MKIRGNTVGTPIKPEKAVLKCRELTDEEKDHACQNIGAARASYVDDEVARLEGLISEAGGSGGGSITVDSALNPSSTNPVQNKVICEQLVQAEATLEQIVGMIPDETDINALIDAKLGVIENGTY